MWALSMLDGGSRDTSLSPFYRLNCAFWLDRLQEMPRFFCFGGTFFCAHCGRSCLHWCPRLRPQDHGLRSYAASVVLNCTRRRQLC